MSNNPLIEKLFSVGAHFGYSPSRRHPSVRKYIFGSKGTAELFDLEQTATCLNDALAFVQSLAAERKVLLFVSSKAEARESVRKEAEKIAAPFVASRWIGGTLSNFPEIKKRINRLAELSDMKEKGELAARFTKKERVLIDREITDLDTMFGGLRSMQKLPDALFIVDPKQEQIAVKEAVKMGIPVIALLNNDCDASNITYPIPGNDASVASLSYIVAEVAKTYAAHQGPRPDVVVQQ